MVFVGASDHCGAGVAAWNWARSQRLSLGGYSRPIRDYCFGSPRQFGQQQLRQDKRISAPDYTYLATHRHIHAYGLAYQYIHAYILSGVLFSTHVYTYLASYPHPHVHGHTYSHIHAHFLPRMLFRFRFSAKLHAHAPTYVYAYSHTYSDP